MRDFTLSSAAMYSTVLSKTATTCWIGDGSVVAALRHDAVKRTFCRYWCASLLFKSLERFRLAQRVISAVGLFHCGFPETPRWPEKNYPEVIEHPESLSRKKKWCTVTKMFLPQRSSPHITCVTILLPGC
jgi:hypothetical protein